MPPFAADASKPLRGLSVLVTRPAHQAASLSVRLQAAGAEVVALPTIEIVFGNEADPSETNRRKPVLSDDLLIFTSANAVVGAHRLSPLPWRIADHCRIAAIGPATCAALAQRGVGNILAPQSSHNSEGLLYALNHLDLRHKRITIVRGDSGRDFLRDQLQRLGARVDYLEVYRRQQPEHAPESIDAAISATTITTVGSNLGLNNLVQLLQPGQAAAVFNRPLVVNSLRCQALAQELGFNNQILIAKPPGDEGQITALQELAASLLQR